MATHPDSHATAAHRSGNGLGPVRTCIGCRRRAPQAQLLRCVLGPAGAGIDRTAPGRGAWLCQVQTCLAGARRKRAFDRAWRTTVTADVLDQLERAFMARIQATATDMEHSTAAGVMNRPDEPRKG